MAEQSAIPSGSFTASGALIRVANIPFTTGNPYQRLMYTGPSTNYQIVNFPKGQFLENANIGTVKAPIIHIHWDDRLFGASTNFEANRANAMQTISQLKLYRANGGRVVWTIHNRRPHKERDSETFEWFRYELCKIVDIIHVHAPHAAVHMVEVYSASAEKIRIIRHPSYLGAYEPADDTLNRPLSDSGIRNFLFFGMFRGNKGLGLLGEAAGMLRTKRQDWTLDVVGQSFASQRRLLRKLNWVEGVSITPDRVPDADIPLIFGNAQAFVVPFQNLFTSGSIMLAQTFGLPIIGPDIPEMRQTIPRACWDLLYTSNRPRKVMLKMLKIVDMGNDELSERREACFEYARETSPEVIGSAFSRALDSIRPNRQEQNLNVQS